MKAKYDDIGKGYNQTRRADPYLTDRLFKMMGPAQGKVYLDVGCGTGNYTAALSSKGMRLIGIDPSRTMLEQAGKRNTGPDFRYGSASNTGLPDESVDGMYATLTLHHWTDLTTAFSELYRVGKKGARLLIFTSTPGQMKGYWLNHYFPKMMKASIKQMPSLENLMKAMTPSGFEMANIEKYFIHSGLQDYFLYCGKRNPELYFDPDIRQGISSFSSLSDQIEVKNGLRQLRVDISSGRLLEIMRSYDNELGDYLFILAVKS
jgi:ubiquinone/menaquinone biosynthesis C-methylase UbiE